MGRGRRRRAEEEEADAAQAGKAHPREARAPPRDTPSRRPAAAAAPEPARAARRPVTTNANAVQHAVQEAAARELRTMLNKKLGLVRSPSPNPPVYPLLLTARPVC